MNNQEQQEAALFEGVKEGAIHNLLQPGVKRLAPFAFVHMNDEIHAIELPLWDRDVARSALAMIASKVPWFITVTEVWVVRCASREEAENGPPPSTRPDRTEAVLVSLVRNGRTVHTATRPFTRTNQGVTLDGDWSENGEMETPAGSIMPPSAFDKS